MRKNKWKCEKCSKSEYEYEPNIGFVTYNFSGGCSPISQYKCLNCGNKQEVYGILPNNAKAYTR